MSKANVIMIMLANLRAGKFSAYVDSISAERAAEEEKRLRIERAMAGCQAKDAISRFNYHLDNCIKCRENPFNLCEVGYSLIFDAYKEREIVKSG